jgi:hypothetical protein
MDETNEGLGDSFVGKMAEFIPSVPGVTNSGYAAL